LIDRVRRERDEAAADAIEQDAVLLEVAHHRALAERREIFSDQFADAIWCCVLQPSGALVERSSLSRYRQRAANGLALAPSHHMTTDWPADAASLAAARRFIDGCTGKVVVAAHNDTDGLCAAVIVLRALAARGVDADPLPARRGEHVHQDAMRARIAERHPDALVVVDMGTRAGSVIPGLPTLIIDHHDATAGAPSDAVLVNGYDREPVAPSSVLAFVVCRHVPMSTTTSASG
jgi:hypothetical protein